MPNPQGRKLAEQRFTASIKVAGINPYVDVSSKIVDALGGERKTPVLVKVAPRGETFLSARQRSKLRRHVPRLKAIGRLAPGGWFRSTIVPVGSRGSRLYLDKWMRESAGVGPGDSVSITLKVDAASRELSMPKALREALDRDTRANAAWEDLPPSRRKEILSYLNFLKTPTALERNVQKTITDLIADDDGLENHH